MYNVQPRPSMFARASISPDLAVLKRLTKDIQKQEIKEAVPLDE